MKNTEIVVTTNLTPENMDGFIARLGKNLNHLSQNIDLSEKEEWGIEFKLQSFDHILYLIKLNPIADFDPLSTNYNVAN